MPDTRLVSTFDIGDEIDGMDEAMLPCDFETEGAILDDHIYSRFVLPMREGVHVVSLVSYNTADPASLYQYMVFTTF